MVHNEWKSYQLSELCAKPISYGIVQTGENIEDGIPCLRVVDLSTEKMNPNELIKTSHEINQAYKKTILEDNEIVMALRGGVGLVRLIDANLVGANITRGLARISAKKGIIHPEYLLWELRSPRFRADLIRRVGGSALQEISLSELRKVNTLVPSSLNEQKKIAQILSTWDQAILATEKLLENSQQQKNALMQQVLTGKKCLLDENGVRFSGVWKHIKLRSLIKEIKRDKEENPNNIELLTVKLHNKGAVASGKFPNSTEGGRPYYKRFAGELIIGRQNLHNGGVAIVPSECNGLIASNAISSFEALNDCDINFILSIMSTSHFRYLIDNLTGGTGQKEVSVRELLNVFVLIPCVEEQQKIAKVLTIADQEIEILQKKLDCLKQEKKALMQQLLTGKKRVKVVV